MASRYSYSRSVGGVIMIIAGIIALILVLHIVLVLLNANSDNVLADFLTNASNTLGLWFKDLFTPGDVKLRVLVNYGLAALFYLIVGRVVGRLVDHVA